MFSRYSVPMYRCGEVLGLRACPFYLIRVVFSDPLFFRGCYDPLFLSFLEGFSHGYSSTLVGGWGGYLINRHRLFPSFLFLFFPAPAHFQKTETFRRTWQDCQRGLLNMAPPLSAQFVFGHARVVFCSVISSGIRLIPRVCLCLGVGFCWFRQGPTWVSHLQSG